MIISFASCGRDSFLVMKMPPVVFEPWSASKFL